MIRGHVHAMLRRATLTRMGREVVAISNARTECPDDSDGMYAYHGVPRIPGVA